jgi:glycosyltransferase 2 family protein
VTERERWPGQALRGYIAPVVGSFWTRLVVSASIMTIVLLQVNLGATFDRIRGADLPLILLSAVLLVALLAVGALRFHILLRAAEVDPSARRAVRAFAMGTFTNTFLPTSVGGDAVRAWAIARPGIGFRPAISIVLLDRAMGLAGMIVVAWGGLLLEHESIPRATALLLVWVSLGGLTAVVVASIFARRLPRSVTSFVTDRARRQPLVLAVGCSILMQTLYALHFALAARALDVHIPLGLVAVVVALVVLLTLVPVSVGGVGVREGGYAVLLAPAGFARTDAVVVSLVTTAMLTLVSLPCGLAMLSGGPSRPTRDALKNEEV